MRVGGWGGGAPPQHLSVGIPLESPLSIEPCCLGFFHCLLSPLLSGNVVILQGVSPWFTYRVATSCHRASSANSWLSNL